VDQVTSSMVVQAVANCSTCSASGRGAEGFWGPQNVVWNACSNGRLGPPIVAYRRVLPDLARLSWLSWAWTWAGRPAMRRASCRCWRPRLRGSSWSLPSWAWSTMSAVASHAQMSQIIMKNIAVSNSYFLLRQM